MHSPVDSDYTRLPGWTVSLGTSLAIGVAMLIAPATAQQLSSSILEEVVVTATKKNIEETVHDVPLALTVYRADQLDALHVRDLADLSFSMPNVQLDDIATVKGTANFSIRGLGINSSIPSIDPTVGVFVDGMYMGGNSGVLLDMFVNGGAKLVPPGGAKLVHLTLCGTQCWGVVPVVHRRDPRCFV